MGLREIVRSQSTGEQTGYEALEVPQQGADTLEQAVEEYPRKAIVARPNKSNGGIPAMHEVLESMHTTDTSSPRFSRKTENVAAAHSFELRYARDRPDAQNRVLSMQYLAGSDDRDGMLEEQLTHNYPDSLFDRQSPIFLNATAGQYVAGATLALRRYTLYPIKSVAIDGFGSDPTGSIIQQMVSHGKQATAGADADVVVQIMFRPALRDWLQGVSNGHGVDPNPPAADSTVIEGTPSVSDLTWALKQPTWEQRRHRYFPWKRDDIKHEPTKRDLAVAKMLNEQDGKAWQLYFRIFALSHDPEVAIARAAKTAGMFRNYYEYRGEQTFVSQPFRQAELPDQLYAGAQRVFEDVGIVKTQSEVAGVVNIPRAEDVSTNKMQWALSKPGDGVPSGTPRFDYKAHGVVDATPDEQQLAMFASTDPNEPIWAGRGVKHGIEAGIDLDRLETHMLVAGRTGYGKTTFVENVISQITRRILTAKARQGYGGVINDPKGKDADDFIREWPEERREEDLVVMDLGEDPNGEPYDNLPQYNFLEIPAGVDPDTRIGASMIEAMADGVAGIVADAGGTDGYLGSVMKRVTKTVCRGMLQSGRSVSLLDLACAVSNQDGLEEFSEWMDEERITFIRETARRQAATKTDDALDPLAGRMDEWVHNRAVRDLICARDPTFSLYDLVNEGKWLVVRFPDWAGPTEKRLLSTSLILGTYFNKRACENDDPFYLMCDEFDKIITKHSNMDIILSEARAHHYHCILACQAPGNQFPDDHPIRAAVEDNINTHISFNPGGKSNSQFIAGQHTVDANTLRELDEYTFYMRTNTDHGRTDSYLVEGWKPIREAREHVTGTPGRSDEEVEALKLRSMERYGAPPKSAEEQQAEAYFTGNGATTALEDDEDGNRPLVETLLTKASYDEVLHATRDEFLDSLIEMGAEPDSFATWVNADSVRERFVRYLADVDTRAAESVSQSSFASLLETTNGIEIRDHEGTTQIRCRESAPNRFKGSGDHATAGGIGHRQLLKQAYEPLTRLGLEVSIPEQTGGRDVDAVGRIRESLPERELVERGECSPREFANARAAFFEEYPRLAALTDGDDVTIEAEKATATKPGKTCRNLAKAHAQGQKCLFIVPKNLAMRVHNALADPPYVNWDDGTRARLYNLNTLSIDGETPLRPNTSDQTHWHLEHETGDLILMDGDDGDSQELARFSSFNPVESSLSAYPAHTGDVDPATIGEHGDWRPVKAPFDPREAFGDEYPTEDDWEILTVGDDVTTLSPFVAGDVQNIPPQTNNGHDSRRINLD